MILTLSGISPAAKPTSPAQIFPLSRYAQEAHMPLSTACAPSTHARTHARTRLPTRTPLRVHVCVWRAHAQAQTWRDNGLYVCACAPKEGNHVHVKVPVLRSRGRWMAGSLRPREHFLGHDRRRQHVIPFCISQHTSVLGGAQTSVYVLCEIKRRKTAPQTRSATPTCWCCWSKYFLPYFV